MKRTPFLLALLALATVAWILLQQGITRRDRVADAGTSTAGETPKGPQLETDRTSTQAASPGRVLLEREPETELLPSSTTDELAFAAEDIYGVVVDSEGSSLADAQVVLYPLDMEEGQPPADARTTGPDGRFRFQDLGAFETFFVFVHREGFVTRRNRAHTGSALRLHLEPALELTGKVVLASDDRPLSDVSVEAFAWAWTGESAEKLRTRSDAQGRFRLAGLRSGAVSLQALRPNGDSSSHRMKLERSLGDCVLRLGATTPPAEMRLIEAETGMPLVETELLWREHVRRTTDSDGRFMGSMIEGLFFSVDVEGFCSTQMIFGEEPDVRPVPVPIVRGSRVEGYVLSADGAAVPDAKVTLTPGRRTLAPSVSFPSGASIGVRSSRTIRTNSEGFFFFEDIPPASSHLQGDEMCHLTAFESTLGRAEQSFQSLRSGKTLRVELQLERPTVLHGSVTTEGAPAQGAFVQAIENESKARAGCAVNDVGAYRLLLPRAGTFTLSASSGELWSTDSVHIESGQILHHDLILQHSGAEIRGRVMTPSGDPIEDALVYARGTETSFFSEGLLQSTGHTTGTDADGAFVLDVGEQSRPVTVAARYQGVEADRATHTGATDVDLIIEPCSWLRVRPTAPDGRSLGSLPPWLLAVRCEGDAQNPETRFSIVPTQDASGVYDIGVPSGTWDVVVYQHGFAPAFVKCLNPGPANGPVQGVPLTPGVEVVIELEGAGSPNWGDAHAWTPDDPLSRRGLLPNILDRSLPLALAGEGNPWPNRIPGRYELTDLPEGWRCEPMVFNVPDVERHEVTIRFWQED